MADVIYYNAYPAPVAGWVIGLGPVNIVGDASLAGTVITMAVIDKRTGQRHLIAPAQVFSGTGHPLDSGAAVDSGNILRFNPPQRKPPEQILLCLD